MPVTDAVQEPPVPIIDVGDGDQRGQDDDIEVLCPKTRCRMRSSSKEEGLDS